MWKRLPFARSMQGFVLRDGGRKSNLSFVSLVDPRKIQESTLYNCGKNHPRREFSNVEDRPVSNLSNNERFGDDDIFAIVTGVDPSTLTAKERAPTAMLRPIPNREFETPKKSGREVAANKNSTPKNDSPKKETERNEKPRKEKKDKPIKEDSLDPLIPRGRQISKVPKKANTDEASESDEDSEEETPKSLKKKQKEALRKVAIFKPLKNEQITAPNIRLNYVNDQSEKKSEVMPTSAALELAKSKKLDLIVVVPNVDPPICKLQNYYSYISEKRKQDFQIRRIQKLAIPKEIQMKIGIDLNDFHHKMRRTKMFLSEGRTVSVTIFCRVKRRSGGRKKTVNTSLTTMTSVDIITDHLKAYFLDYPLSMNVTDQFVRKFVPNVYKPGQQKVKPNSKTGAGGTFVKVHDRREFLLNFKGSREQMLKRLKEAQLEEVERRNAKAAQAKSKVRKPMNEEQRKKERQRQLLAEAGLGDFEDDEEDDFDEEDEDEELEANESDGDDDDSDDDDDENKGDDDLEEYEDYEEDEDDDLIDEDDLEDDEIDGEWEVVHETQGNEDTAIHQKIKN